MMSRRILLFFIFAFCSLSLAGCAAKWTVETEQHSLFLQWPPAPSPPVLKHVLTLKGFEESGISFSTVLFGKGRQSLVRPVAVATGRDGRIAVADSGAKCVHLYFPSDQRYLRLDRAGGGELASPVGLVFDEELRLYVADSLLRKVFVFDARGEYLFAITSANELKRPTGLAYDRSRGLLYLADTLSHKIFAFDKNGKVVFSFGERGTGNGQFNFPTHLFWSGLLYVTDTMNFRIQIFEPGGKLLSSFGNHGDGSGDFSMPKGIAADREGVIYVVDTLFDNIQLFNSRGKFLLTVGGRGAGQGEFWLPSGIYIDEKNRLYLCDTFNQRVQVFQIFERSP